MRIHNFWRESMSGWRTKKAEKTATSILAIYINKPAHIFYGGGKTNGLISWHKTMSIIYHQYSSNCTTNSKNEPSFCVTALPISGAFSHPSQKRPNHLPIMLKMIIKTRPFRLMIKDYPEWRYSGKVTKAHLVSPFFSSRHQVMPTKECNDTFAVSLTKRLDQPRTVTEQG